MKINTRLLLIAALFVLALPLILTGTAGAGSYNPDGAQLNGTTGLWEVPAYTNYMGCAVGTATIDTTPTSATACQNTAVALTTQSACTAAVTVTSPGGWGSTNGAARWSACSEGRYPVVASANAPIDCVTGGGTVTGFNRCSRQLDNTDCAALGGWTSGGTSSSTWTCTRTDLTAANCALQTGTVNSHAYVGSAAVAGATTTCSAYVGNDAAWCTTRGGTISSQVDETRGSCGGTTSSKFTGTDTTANAMGGTNADWSTTGNGTRKNCLKCHSTQYYGDSNNSRTNEDYLNASHKNASRKIVPGKGLANVYVDTDGNEQFGVFPYVPGGFSGTDAGQIRRTDWVNGKLEDTTGGLKNLPTGVYTEWYWELGYYGEDPERGVFNMETQSNGKPLAKMQACFKCHATGYVSIAAKDTTKEPETSFSGISWDGTTTYTVGSRPGVVNFIGAMTDRNTNVKTTSTYGAWDQYGVVCAKCHNSWQATPTSSAGHHSGADGINLSMTGPGVNAVCGQCHIRAGSSDWAVSAGTGVLTTRANVGTGHPNYHETDYLNSPHARFTGTYGQVGTSSMYNSAFMTNTANHGCAGCHNPHGSVREALIELTEGTDAEPSEGIEVTCLACHTTLTGNNSQGKTLTVSDTNINHPTGDGTPMGTEVAPTDGCAICHMPSGRHLFRITLDTNYTTTAPTAFTAKPDGTFTEAVWVDVKSSCLQCHVTGNTVGAPVFNTTQAAAAANNMHTGGSATNADCLVCHATGIGGAPIITPGTNHHGQFVTCVTCHTGGHNGTLPDKTNNTWCLTCHTNSGPYAVHHAVAGLSVTCSSCHTTPGVLTAAQATSNDRTVVTSNCLGCHSSVQNGGAIRVLVVSGAGDNHHRGSGTSTARSVAGCLYCHAKGKPFGDATTEAQSDATADGKSSACLACHAVNQGVDHHNGSCVDCHAPSGPAPAGVTTPSWASRTNLFDCTACHSVGGGNGPATSHHVIADDPWTSTTCEACHPAAGVLPASSACSSCHSGSGTATRSHHSGSTNSCTPCHTQGGVTPTLNLADRTAVNTNCQTCHVTAQGTKRALILSGAGDNHHNGSGTSTARSTAGCAYCHSTGKAFGDASTEVMLDQVAAGSCSGACHATAQASVGNHHTGDCLVCHLTSPAPFPGKTDVISEAIPNDRTSVTTYCLGCHSTIQGSSRALIVSGAGDNHHRGSGTSTARSVAGCLYCHGSYGGVAFGGATTEARGDATTNGKTSACEACHTPIQSGPTQNHHSGDCLTCHTPTGPAPAGVTTPSFPPANVADCTACHASGGPNGPATGHHLIADDPWTSTTCEECHPAAGVRPADPACTACHSGSGTAPRSHHSGSTNSCTPCHTQGGVTPTLNLANRTAVNNNCQTCHISIQGTKRALILSGAGDNHHNGSGTSTARSTAGCAYCHSTGLAFGDATTEVIQDSGATQSCSGACHASSQAASGTHHTGAGLTPVSGTLCLACHTPNSAVSEAPGVTDSAVYPLASWEDCSACHPANGPNPATHHVTTSACTTCHVYAGIAPSSNCVACHDGTPGPIKTVENHRTTAGTPGVITDQASCRACHSDQGGNTPSTALCSTCHGSKVPPIVVAAGTLAYRASVMHAVPSAPVVNFVTSVSGLTVNASSTSTCPNGGCTYQWTSSVTGTTDTAASTSFTYAAPGGTKTITLTVTDGIGGSGSMSQPVTVVAPNTPPSCGSVVVSQPGATGKATNMTARVVGNFTDPDGDPVTVTVAWGDTQTDTSAGGTGVTLPSTSGNYHPYLTPGVKHITWQANDNRGGVCNGSYDLTASLITVSGTVVHGGDLTPVSGAAVTLTGTDAAGNSVSKNTTSLLDGTYSIPNLQPSSAVIGYTVAATGYTTGTSMPMTSIVTNQTVNFTSTERNITVVLNPVTVPPQSALTGTPVAIYLKNAAGVNLPGMPVNSLTGTTFLNKSAGTYKVQVVKSGKVFDCDGTIGAPITNPVTVTVGASNVTVTCTHTP